MERRRLFLDPEIENTAHDLNNFYNGYLDKLSIEIIEGVKEGFAEGLKTGIRNGLLESFKLGFLGTKKEKIRTLEEILKDASSEGLKNMASTMTKRNACPALEGWLKKRCDEAISMISSRGVIKTTKDATELAGYLNLEEKADKKMDDLSNQAKQAFLSNFIFESLFQGIQSTLWGCTKNGIKGCQKRITEMKD